MTVYHVISWGILDWLSHVFTDFLHLEYSYLRMIHWVPLTFFFLSYTGFPIIIIGISLSIAAIKEGIQSFTSDKKWEIYFTLLELFFWLSFLLSFIYFLIHIFPLVYDCFSALSISFFFS